MTKVEYSAQVLDFLRSLAPTPRRALVRAMKALPAERGDIKPLQGDLTGFLRLRVRGYRVIFRRVPGAVRCEFAENRSIIYELFAIELERLKES